MADVTNIAGRINSISQEGVAVVASQTLDERKNKKQSVVNQEADEELANHGQRIGTLEQEVGSGGSVDERIAQAKSESESDIKGGASSDYDTLKKAEDAIKAEAAARQEADSSLDGRMRTLEDNSVRYTPQTPSQTEQAHARTNLDTYSKAEVNQIASAFTEQNYVSVQAVAATTAADIPTLINATGDGEQTDTLYRVGWFDGTAFDVTKYSLYTWNGTAYVQMAVCSSIGEVFDISVYNQSGGTPAQYETLALALGTDGANVPSGVRQGGMSVKFIQSNDNNYVQYRLMSDSFSTAESDWQGVDEVPTLGSDNLVKSGGVVSWGEDMYGSYIENPEFVYVKTDNEDKILYGVKTDGEFFFGVGCPQQVKNYIEEKISSLPFDEYEDIVEFLSDYLGSDTTLKAIIDDINERIPEIIENPEFLEVTTDSEDKILAGRTPDGAAFENVGFSAPKVSTESVDIDGHIVENIEDPEGRTEIKTDAEGKILSYRDGDGVLHESVGIEAPNIGKSNVYLRNQHKEVSLLNACRANNGDYTIRQDLQLCVVNDSHTDDPTMERAIEIANKFNTIDGMIHCGDITWTTFTPDYVKHFFDNIMSKCEKPWFIALGNHDVGMTLYLNYSASHEDEYKYFIKPMVDAGSLAQGEFEVGKSYYYHDFLMRKIRLIVLIDFDAPLDSTDDLFESNYWEPVAYNSSYSQIQDNHDYIYDANNPVYVNCGNHKNFSFRLKQTVHTTSWSGAPADIDITSGWTRPAYKIARGSRVIRKEQADWFINTLANTPSGYGVVVASHIPACLHFKSQKDKMFTCKTLADGDDYGVNNPFPLISMKTDMICDIIQAFIDRTILNENVVMMADGWNISDASYMNTHTDAEEDYAYSITADFTNVPSNCYFVSFIGGHLHEDHIYRHPTYLRQWAFHGITLRQQYNGGDVARSGYTDSVAADNVNAVSFARNRLAIVRIGNDETMDGLKRDFEVIKTNENN